MKSRIINFSKYLLLALLLYLPVFGHLDNLPLRIWDESRLAISAFEMHKNGDWLVTYFDGVPDLWNTKPPLMIWLQVIFMKLIGEGELAIRLPSAFAALITCIALLWFSIKYIKDSWFGFIVVLVLITTNGYIDYHGTRTGDYDALLTLFTTLYCLFYFSYIETEKRKFLYLFFVCLTLAIFTKSVAGVLFLPALLIYTIWQKKLPALLRSKEVYIGAALVLITVASYYFFREAKIEGYLHAVQNNELGGRYLNALEEHKEEFLFYYKILSGFQFSYWLLFIPCGMLLGLLNTNNRLVKLTVFSSICAITFFLIISSAQTKLQWYDIPIFPFLAIITAIFVYNIFRLIKNFEPANRMLHYNILPFIFMYLVFLTPYQKIFDKTYIPRDYERSLEFYQAGYLMKDALKGKINLTDHYLVQDGYNAHNLFYIKLLQDKGVNISFKDWKALEPGDKVIAYQPEVKKYISRNYSTTLIKKVNTLMIYKINARSRKLPAGNPVK